MWAFVTAAPCMVGCDSNPQEGHTPAGGSVDGWLRRFVVLLPQNQLSDGGIITNWIDSADWVTGIEYRRAARWKHLRSRLCQLSWSDRWDGVYTSRQGMRVLAGLDASAGWS